MLGGGGPPQRQSGNRHLKSPSVRIMLRSLRPRPTHSCTLHKYNKNRCLDVPLGNKGRLIPGADYFLLHLFSQRKISNHNVHQDIAWKTTNPRLESLSIRTPQGIFNNSNNAESTISLARKMRHTFICFPWFQSALIFRVNGLTQHPLSTIVNCFPTK